MRDTQRDTYKLVNWLKEKAVDDSIIISRIFDVEVQKDLKTMQHKDFDQDKFKVSKFQSFMESLVENSNPVNDRLN